MKTWKFTLTLEVADCWVEDGFRPTAEMLKNTLQDNLCGSAFYDTEFIATAKLVKEPDLSDLVLEV